jgi:hypothetical protein
MRNRPQSLRLYSNSALLRGVFSNDSAVAPKLDTERREEVARAPDCLDVGSAPKTPDVNVLPCRADDEGFVICGGPAGHAAGIVRQNKRATLS